MERKIIFFDIDGTLITDDGNRIFPDSAKRAISLARSKGHLTFINTGRVYVNIEDFIKDAGFDGYVCGCGTYIVADGEVILHNKLDKGRCREIAHICRDCRMMAIFEHANHTAYDSEAEGDAHREILEYFKNMDRKLIDSIDSDEFVFDKFSAWYDDKSDLDRFRNEVEKDFTYIDREGSFCELMPKGFSKATGIEYLLNHYGIKLENAYAFGDSNNDLDMLKYVPNAIAMGVCSDKVAEVATFKTTEVMNDGIYNAMIKLGII